MVLTSRHYSIALVDLPVRHGADIARAIEVAERTTQAAIGSRRCESWCSPARSTNAASRHRPHLGCLRLGRLNSS